MNHEGRFLWCACRGCGVVFDTHQKGDPAGWMTLNRSTTEYFGSLLGSIDSDLLRSSLCPEHAPLFLELTAGSA
jgi:hypothetical protein